MKRNASIDWLWRSLASALLSALSVHYLDRQFSAFYWGPGLAFALMVVTARSKSPELLAAVTLSYTLGYASGDLLENLGAWPNRIGVVAIGSALLALSLRWKGGFSLAQSRQLFLVGTVLSLPFWLLLTQASGEPSLPLWVAGFAVWQLPVSYLILVQTKGR